MDENEFTPTLSECIDACRAGYDDLATAEFAVLARRLDEDARLRETYERSQRFDISIGQAFQDIQAPKGLADRLLARLAVSDDLSERELLDLDAVNESHIVSTAEIPASANDSRSRRWYRRAIVSGAVAASLVVGLFAFGVFSGDQGYSKSELQDLALRWVEDLPQTGWNQDIQAAPANRPLPTSFARSIAARQWRSFDTEPFGKAVVYDLTPPGKGFVFVFVVRTQAEFPDVGPNFPSQQPDSNTHNRCQGFAWKKSKGLLYVLVVEGQDVNRYRSLFNQHPFT